jgi:MFS family permease
MDTGLGGGPSDPRPARERYGWIVVATLAITETVSWGVLYYTFSVFVTPMEQELGWTRTETTGAFSLALATAALAAVPVGRWLDLRSPRVLMSSASVLGLLLIVAWSSVRDLVTLYLVWAGLGLVMAALLYEAAFTVITKWFVVGRRAALTAVTLVAGLASFIFVPLTNWLVETYEWRPALLVLAGIFGVVTFPLHAIVLRPAPPLSASTGKLPATSEIAVPPRAAARSPVFWLLATAFAVSSFLTAALTVHLVPYLVGSGYPSDFAAISAGLLGATQVLGRVLFATVLRLLPPWAEPAVAFSLQGAGLLLLGITSGAAGVLIAAVLFGLGNGMATLVRALAFSDAFGARWYGTVAGLASTAAVGARAAAPVSIAVAFDAIGSYRPLFVVLAAASLFAVLAAASAHQRSSDSGPVGAR